MRMTQYVAYEGSEFTIEWYCDEKGISQALQYFLGQPKDMQRKALNLFRLMGEHGKIHDETKFRNESDGIYAFKPQPDRYLCFFFKGKKIIVTNAFEKKSQKLPKGEKNRSLKARTSYEMRVVEGAYYEEEK
jgi:phage-related protein